MKKTNLAILILAGILALHQLMNGQVVTQDTIFFPNMTVCTINTHLDGHPIERCVFYPTGEVRMIAEYDPLTGLQHGDEFWYWQSGEAQEATTYVNGYAHGYCFGWDPSGEPTFTKLYVESHEVPLEDFDRYFPPGEYQKQPNPSAFALRAKGQ